MEIPQQDKRVYHAGRLANGLDCLLISDPSTDKAAAALSVCAGQMQDPPNFPGLAHLTEHLVFLGAKDFPQENEYDRYLAQHGGHSNAYTDLELTCFYCDVQAGALAGALARFGACMTDPLMLLDSIEREIQAVDSEHSKNKQQDSWRSNQLAKTILGAANENHPYSSFGTGNLDVLLPKIGSEDDDTSTNNQDTKAARIHLLREQVLTFFDRYYKTPNMKLVVLGQETVQELQAMAEQFFGRIAAADSSCKPSPLPPLHTEPAIVHWVPVRDGRTLSMQWILPEQRSRYRSKPTRYLSHLLGHEGPGSLLQVLRNLQWAQELSADDMSKATSTFTVFSIEVELTMEGFEHVNEVVQLVYKYIRLMDEIPPWVHEELAVTAEMQFRFLSQQEASDTVSCLAVNMQHYKFEHYISGPYKIYDYEPAMTKACWECLSADNMIVMVAAKEFAEEADQTDIWYGTKFKLLTASELAHVQHLVSDLSEADILTDKLALPEPNDMLATDFVIVETLYDVFKTDKATPKCLVDNSTCRLWYIPDTVFLMPKVNAMFLLRTPMISESPRQTVLGSVWSEVVTEFCNEFSYVAYMAGLHCDFSSNHSGVEITVSGYSHKADVLLKRICRAIDDMPAKLTTEVFDRILDKLEKRYQAFLVAQPYQHAINAVDLCIEVNKWSVQTRLACLKHLELDDLINFHKHLLSRFHLEVLVHGNILPRQAVDWTDILLEAWKPKPLLYRNGLRAVTLSGDTLYRLRGWNDSDENSCVLNLFQIGDTDIKMSAVLSLFLHLVREPAFNQLRTEEQLGKVVVLYLVGPDYILTTHTCSQLFRFNIAPYTPTMPATSIGYIVHTSSKTNAERIKGLLFLIQSDVFDPFHLNERIDAFLSGFRSKLVQMSPEDIKTNVNAVCQTLLEKSKNVSESSAKFWHVIANRTYHFHRLQDVAAEVEDLTKEDVLRFFDKYILKGAPLRRKISIHIFGSNHESQLLEQQARDDDPSIQLVHDPEEFSRIQHLFPMQPLVSIKDQMI
jgi:insulysin